MGRPYDTQRICLEGKDCHRMHLACAAARFITECKFLLLLLVCDYHDWHYYYCSIIDVTSY